MSTARITPEDLSLLRWVDHVRLSPSGDRVAYQVGWPDLESRENHGRVAVVAIAGGTPVEFPSPRRDHSPEWSPDGRRLAFLSRRGARDQLVVVPAEGGEAVQLTELADGVAGHAWSSDGHWLAFLAPVLGDPEGVVDDPRPAESQETLRRPPVARVVRRLDYKHDGSGYVDGRYPHLFVVSVEGGEPIQLTSGAWPVEGFAWAPDGRSLAVVGDAEPDRDLRRTSRLYLIARDGGPLRPICADLQIASPAWSPTGEWIAFLAPLKEEGGELARVWVVSAQGGEPRCLTEGFDRSAGASVVTDMRAGHGTRLRWSADGSRVWFLASGPGVVELCSVGLDGSVRVEVPSERRHLFDFDLAPGVVAAGISDAVSPGEVWAIDASGERQLTDSNPWLRERYVAVPEPHRFTAADGLGIEGWLLKPPDFDPGRRYPLVMQIHGGPHAQYGWGFFHEFQVLAGMGFLVFYVNPRGSDGYGQAFRKAVVGDWAGRDYEDLMTALDQLIERTGFVDVDRMGIAGGSYGGYMTNWVVGHTRRFAAACAMRSLSNLVSDYAQDDIVLWGELEYGPGPWEDLESLWHRSPIRYVKEIQTPLLLLHGEMDLRCPISQAEELFGAMRLLRKEVELVRFPGESHDLSRGGRPDRRIERLRRIAGWFERHLLAVRPQPAAAVGGE